MYFSEIKQKSYYIRNHMEPQPLLKIVKNQEKTRRITHCYRDYKKKADQVVNRSVCSDHHFPSVFDGQHFITARTLPRHSKQPMQ